MKAFAMISAVVTGSIGVYSGAPTWAICMFSSVYLLFTFLVIITRENHRSK